MEASSSRGAAPPAQVGEGLAARTEEESWVHVLARPPSGSNNTYKCPKCNTVFKGGPMVIRVHVSGVGHYGRVRRSACPDPDPAAKLRANEILGELKDKQTKKKSLKRKSIGSVDESSQHPHSASQLGCSALAKAWERGLSLGSKANNAIMEFIAVCNLPARLVDDPSFRYMLRAVTQAGQGYKIPGQRAFGNGGHVLKAAEAAAKNIKEQTLAPTIGLGNTLCADGFTKVRRSSNNSVLLSELGVFFAGHSTFASGVKKTAEVLRDDALVAINGVGIDKVFLVCMDGACKKTLRLLSKEVPSLLTQRCATHAWHLVCAGLLKLFPDQLKLTVRACKFVANHTFVRDAFADLGASLMTPVETRMASSVTAMEKVLADKDKLIELWWKTEVREGLDKAPAHSKAKLQEEHQSLWKELLDNKDEWSRFDAALGVLLPARAALRQTDTDKPNLALSVVAYDKAWLQSIEAAERAEEDGWFDDIKIGVERVFERRKVDCVSPVALAAAAVWPNFFYPGLDEEGNRLPQYSAKGSRTALRDEVLPVLFNHDHGKISTAMSELRAFQEQKEEGYFKSPVAAKSAQNNTASNFWAEAVEDAPTLAPIARKLCSAFAGQGSAERLNKDVANTRCAKRADQTAAVTTARLEISYVSRLHRYKDAQETPKPFLIAVWDSATAIEHERREAEEPEPDAVIASEDEEDEEEEHDERVTSFDELVAHEGLDYQECPAEPPGGIEPPAP